ncbi:ATP:cob(I)alamin adenosyltransferase [Brachybacterium fresconis]|uniref:Corrinoid adenosyltransferase n=1 Tax=Brachybacterium fresconis TaxID=173363 RepID=A0ABS4YGW6_9MICO|nr:cob(I)yrinic acid a c-diamide adenosyltransferase [Brachybacterium fresconis]MBP2408014.1 cob(I)alamin adenosyltransferase [Brachybacterium fresconis]
MSDAQHSHRGEDASLHRSAHALGRTDLGDVGEVTKHDSRLSAFGACEEANVAVGTALAFGDFGVEVAATLTSVQNDLFDLAADLSVPFDETDESDVVRITEQHLTWVDRAYEHYSSQLSPVDGYIVPGGTVPATLLYQARVAVRRAERTTLAAMAEFPGSTNALVPRYLNSASSLFFVLARTHNAELGDTMWNPLGSVTARTQN